jgi:hypothetical protein
MIDVLHEQDCSHYGMSPPLVQPTIRKNAILLHDAIQELK